MKPTGVESIIVTNFCGYGENRVVTKLFNSVISISKKPLIVVPRDIFARTTIIISKDCFNFQSYYSLYGVNSTDVFFGNLFITSYYILFI